MMTPYSIQPQEKHPGDVDGRARPDMVEILIEPLRCSLPPFVAQSAQQAPLRVKLRRGTELRHQTVISNPVHKHAAMFFPVQLAAIDQPRRERDCPHLSHE